MQEVTAPLEESFGDAPIENAVAQHDAHLNALETAEGACLETPHPLFHDLMEEIPRSLLRVESKHRLELANVIEW